MSTDLELRLPPLIKISHSTHTQISDHNSSATNDHENSTTAQSRDVVDEEEECHTPRSPRHTIPAMLICPPPPKKPRRMVEDSCKRKLRFFETVSGEEIESFFRTVEVNCVIVNGGSTKRKLCLM